MGGFPVKFLAGSVYIQPENFLTHDQVRARSKHERYKRCMRKRLEKFISQVYSHFPSDLCVNALISHKFSCKPFERHLHSQGDDEYLRLYHDSQEILNESDFKKYLVLFQKLYQNYIFPRNVHKILPKGRAASLLSQGLKVKCFAALKDDDPNQPELIKNTAKLFQLEAISILTTYYFPSYILSKEYLLWRQNESNHAIAFTSVRYDENFKTVHLVSSSGEVSTYKSIKIEPAVVANGFSSHVSSKIINISMKSSFTASSPTDDRKDKEDKNFMSSMTQKFGGFLKSPQSPRARMYKVRDENEDQTCSNEVLPFNSEKYTQQSIESTKIATINNLEDRESNNTLLNFAEQAYSRVNKIEVSRIFNGDNWIAILLAASEGIPIGISLCSAPQAIGPDCKVAKESKVIFVNSSYENISGTNRLAVMGRPTFSLFESNGSVIKKSTVDIKPALLTGKVVGSVLSIDKPDGNSVDTVVVVKPLFDTKKYTYAIILHMDATGLTSFAQWSRLTLLTRVADFLPEEVFSDPGF